MFKEIKIMIEESKNDNIIVEGRPKEEFGGGMLQAFALRFELEDIIQSRKKMVGTNTRSYS